MSFVVIAYPKIDQNDYKWIQGVRKENDPVMFSVVKPHVTFIFPTNKLDATSLAKHVKEHLAGFKSFPVVFDSTKVVEDDSKTYTHTFLVPSVGFDDINKLHDLLYVDEMASELRLDIPFVPHLGIGTNADKDAMQALAKSITKSGKSVSGTINELVVGEYDGKKVTDIAVVSLDLPSVG